MGNELVLAQPRAATLQADVRDLVGEWHAAIDLSVRAGEMAETTSTTYKLGLEKFLTWAERRSVVSESAIQEWIADLREKRFKPSAINTWLAGVRSFFAWAFRTRRIFYNPCDGLKGLKRRGTSQKHIRNILTDREMLRLLKTPDTETPQGKRDMAMISVFAYTAARQSDLQRADLEDLQTTSGRLVLNVQGKGRQEKDEVLVIAHADAEGALRDWLGVRGAKAGPLFTSLSHRSNGERLSLRAIRGLVKDYYAKAGITGAGKTTHSLRHTAITNAIRNGAAIQRVQSMARHQSLTTTSVYYHEVDRLQDPAESHIEYGNT
ncbi:MAG: site-specific integrase [Chloroflexi bacterium]|nr:site-specific integrase [Chloroflexota bacterium]